MSRLFPAASSSHAPFSVRPDARPLKRTDSAVSLPSPPMSRAEFLNERDQAPLAALQFPPSPEHSNEDEPMNLDAPGANPFRAQNLKSTRPERPDHPSASPTQHVRKQRRIDKDRILLLKKEPEALLGMGRGWDSPSNPFIERPGEAAQRQDRVKAPKPEKMTYVFRGKRIVYDFPIDNLLMQDPDESPFAVPSPRLLFPAPPVTPPAADPTISFLDALRTVKRSQRELDYGLPTPAREKDSKRVKRTAAMQDRPSEE